MDIERSIRLISAHAANHGGTRKAGDIRYLIYHYTGNKGDTALNNGKYYSQKVSPPASAHYFVDDREVVQSVGDLTIAWAVGGGKWSDCAKTDGGKFYGIAKNANSISIEMCGTKSKDSREASETTLENAAALGRLLMMRYNIPLENVIRHFDVTGKYCPAYLMDNEKWAAFKSRLSGMEQTCSVVLPALTRGCKGAPVRAVQTLLNLHGANLAVDGSFGPATEAALKAHNGKVDAATWAELITK